MNQIAVIVVASLLSLAYKHLRELYSVKEEKTFDLFGKLKELKRIRNSGKIKSFDEQEKIKDSVEEKIEILKHAQSKIFSKSKVRALRAKFEQRYASLATTNPSKLGTAKESDIGEKSNLFVASIGETTEIEAKVAETDRIKFDEFDHFDESNEAEHSRSYHEEIRKTDSIVQIVDMLQANSIWTESEDYNRVYLLLNGYDYDTIFEVLQWKQINAFSQ